MVKAAHTVMACCSMTFGQHQIVSVAQNNLNNIKSLSFSALLLASALRSQKFLLRAPMGVTLLLVVRALPTPVQYLQVDHAILGCGGLQVNKKCNFYIMFKMP
jgi:hypothetical protein